MSWPFKNEQVATNRKQEVNEKILLKLSEGCGGHLGTAAEVLEDIAMPSIKRVRDYATYTGPLGKSSTLFTRLVLSFSLGQYLIPSTVWNNCGNEICLPDLI